jgi:hypothetical protein
MLVGGLALPVLSITVVRTFSIVISAANVHPDLRRHLRTSIERHQLKRAALVGSPQELRCALSMIMVHIQQMD